MPLHLCTSMPLCLCASAVQSLHFYAPALYASVLQCLCASMHLYTSMPVCLYSSALQVYRDTEPTPMVCCDKCEHWVHTACGNIR